MAESRAFMKYARQEIGHRPIAERVHDFKEFDLPLTPEKVWAAIRRGGGR